MNLHIERLQHTYKSPAPGVPDRTVLNVPQWTLKSGEQVLLRGVSGSGKTTLFNIIAGLLHPTAGTVHYDGTALYELSEAVRDRLRAGVVGYVFQTHHLLPALTALENVVVPMAFAQKLPRSTWRGQARDLLAQVGLADFVAYRPAQLSTGQRLRVAVARALANNPRLLLADEPTAALDADSSSAVMETVQQACRANTTTLIVASHDPTLGEQFAQVVHLRHGILHLDAPQAETQPMEGQPA